MKGLKCMMILLLLLEVSACGSELEMDQNLNDPRALPGQNDNNADDAGDSNDNTNDDTNDSGGSDTPPDDDGDGISNDQDQCPETPGAEEADENGCAPSQKDSDQDGISDAADTCPDTPPGEEVNNQGCAASQLDSDDDGVNDATDQCPDTPAGREVNEQGCHTPQIGEFYQGGYVFYIFQPGDDRYISGEVHGLIAATEALETPYPWMPEGANFERVFYDDMSRDGEINTEKIVKAYGEGVYAARVCYDLEYNGFSDWYLASGVENAILCINLAHNNDPEIADGYSTGDQYWTSFETSLFYKKIPEVVYGITWSNLNDELRSKIVLSKDNTVYECFVTSFDICQTDDMYSKTSLQPVIPVRQF
ncbi:hypothetical protein [Robertkochia flava]|uniref:hypothetical protein n=1 Tax=Robertkochia flava TaxID=3447986 RepID=UPI001CCA6B75|nr:hypothetical protein [Robertkochia marina]